MNVTYSSAENIAKNFSNNLNNLRNLEDQINQNSKLPNINNSSNLRNELEKNAQNKLNNENYNPEEMQNKLNKMREVIPKVPDYKTEEQKKVIANKEAMSEEGMNKFNVNLITALNEYSTGIQKTISDKNKNDSGMYEMIKKGIDSIKDDLTKRIENFNKESKNTMDFMQKIMSNSSNPRLQLLSEHLFNTKDLDDIIKIRNKRKDGQVIDVHKMSAIVQNQADASKALNEKLKKEELLSSLNQTKQNLAKGGKNSGEEVEKIPLDLWEKRRKNNNILHKKIRERLAIMGQNYTDLQPINRFRSYVYIIIAARRMLNIRYLVYKELKFDAVSYYISNFEDMDIILKKLVYNSVKEPLLEILNDSELVLNLTTPDQNNHDIYNLFQDYMERIIKGFNEKFFKGISDDMLTYLSLYVCNQSFIPKDFFTTFELVRFRTTETGEFIELDDQNRKMILIFYIFIKILLRNVFLELIFNQTDRKKLSLNAKLNMKMIVSVLYRTLIDKLIKNCVTKTNLDDVEDAEEMTAFLKLRFSKREFKLNRYLKKRYFLKISEVQNKKKRVSVRSREPITPSSENEEDESVRQIRQTNKQKNEIKNKKIQQIEKEQNSEIEENEEEENENEENENEENEEEENENEENEKESSNNKKSNSKKNSKMASKANNSVVTDSSKGTKKTKGSKGSKGTKDKNNKSKFYSKDKKDKKSKSSKYNDSSNYVKEEDEEEDSKNKSDNEEEKNSENSGNEKSGEESNENNGSEKSDNNEKSGSEENNSNEEESSEEDKKNKKKKSKGRAPPPKYVPEPELKSSDNENDEDNEENEENGSEQNVSNSKSKSSKQNSNSKQNSKSKQSSSKNKSSNSKQSSSKNQSSKSKSSNNKNSKKSKSKPVSKKQSKQTSKNQSKSKINKISNTNSKMQSQSQLSKISESQNQESEEEEEKENENGQSEDEEIEINDDNYEEEKAKLMPERKVSTEKINGKVKQSIMGEKPKIKIAIRGNTLLKDKDTIKDFSKSDIDNMYFIIENFQSYGDDLDSNEVDLLDKVLYTNKSLEIYYLYSKEYSFSPADDIWNFTDKLLEKIQINFSK